MRHAARRNGDVISRSAAAVGVAAADAGDAFSSSHPRGGGMWLCECAAATLESDGKETGAEMLLVLGGPAWPANYTLRSEIGSSRQPRAVPHG